MRLRTCLPWSSSMTSVTNPGSFKLKRIGIPASVPAPDEVSTACDRPHPPTAATMKSTQCRRALAEEEFIIKVGARAIVSLPCRREVVFSRGRKGISGAENSFLTVWRLRKTGVAGRQRPCQSAGRKENHRKPPRLTMKMKPNGKSRCMFTPSCTGAQRDQAGLTRVLRKS